jgi:hypothetical protein
LKSLKREKEEKENDVSNHVNKVSHSQTWVRRLLNFMEL